MQPQEIAQLVDDIETRLDRLRALYDQYFMGLEKMEPHVARKDVERKLQSLRREQIRNTGVRFRFQMLLQRFNTYQTYWMRICRKIEEGTYRRSMGLRAVRTTQGEPPLATATASAEKPVARIEMEDAAHALTQLFDSAVISAPAREPPPVPKRLPIQEPAQEPAQHNEADVRRARPPPLPAPATRKK